MNARVNEEVKEAGTRISGDSNECESVSYIGSVTPREIQAKHIVISRGMQKIVGQMSPARTQTATSNEILHVPFVQAIQNLYFSESTHPKHQ